MHLGLKVATAYSLPSFSLGFCGPQDKKSRKTLSDYASGKPASEKAIRKIFEKFEAAYSYYKLIAKKNNIEDPFDEKVLKAFWVGNRLLEQVSREDLQKLILTNFYRPGLLSKTEARIKAQKVPKGATAHHSFHVLILGAVAKRVKLEGSLLDLCRIGWGKVKKLEKNSLIVKYKPLLTKNEIKLGNDIEKKIHRNKHILPKIRIGDYISFHWGEACGVLNKSSLKNLEFYTQKTIGLVNGQNR